MSTSVRLRTLALLSIMNFGRHTDMTVQQILTFKRVDGLRYLTWVYYNCSNISFNAEILETLAISEEFAIPKPGNVSKEAYIELSKKVTAIRVQRDIETMTVEEIEINRHNSMVLTVNENRGRVKNTNIHSNRFNNKGHLQALNRGNVKY